MPAGFILMDACFNPEVTVHQPDGGSGAGQGESIVDCKRKVPKRACILAMALAVYSQVGVANIKEWMIEGGGARLKKKSVGLE